MSSEDFELINPVLLCLDCHNSDCHILRNLFQITGNIETYQKLFYLLCVNLVHDNANSM